MKSMTALVSMGAMGGRTIQHITEQHAETHTDPSNIRQSRDSFRQCHTCFVTVTVTVSHSCHAVKGDFVTLATVTLCCDEFLGN